MIEDQIIQRMLPNGVKQVLTICNNGWLVIRDYELLGTYPGGFYFKKSWRAYLNPHTVHPFEP